MCVLLVSKGQFVVKIWSKILVLKLSGIQMNFWFNHNSKVGVALRCFKGRRTYGYGTFVGCYKDVSPERVMFHLKEPSQK